MVVVAVVLVAALGIFGISRIGGETWTSAAANAQAGWFAYTGPLAPPPPTRVVRTFLIPLIMVLVVVAVAILGAVLKRYSNRESEEETPVPPARR